MMMMCARDEENKKLFFFSLSLSSQKKKKKMNRARWMSFLWCSWEIFVVDSFFIFWKKWTNARICVAFDPFGTHNPGRRLQKEDLSLLQK
jgi:hypothetical protein